MNNRAVVCALAVPLAIAAARQVGTDPARTAGMHGYRAGLERLVAAVVRADLDAAREPATALANAPPLTGLPDAMTRYAFALTAAARQTAAAPSLTDAAIGVTRLLAACGACHRASGAHPPVAEVSTTSLLTGTAAHMMEHRRALDRLMRGLLAPSDGEWRNGALALRAAPLHARGNPGDVPLTPSALRTEEAVHRLSEEAVAATTVDGRIRVFSTLLARCADCHGMRPHEVREMPRRREKSHSR